MKGFEIAESVFKRHGTFKSHAAMQRAIQAYIIKHMALRDYVRATYDKAGNCTRCGECGRCPGWHHVSETTA